MFVEHKEQGESPVKVLDKDSEILLSAAAYMEQHGWCQGRTEDAAGRVCMVGAVNAVTGINCSDAWRRLQNAMNGRVGHWNDHPYRTQEQAIAKLRAVALGL